MEELWLSLVLVEELENNMPSILLVEVLKLLLMIWVVLLQVKDQAQKLLIK
jgi:hypothetical protein